MEIENKVDETGAITPKAEVQTTPPDTTLPSDKEATAPKEQKTETSEPKEDTSKPIEAAIPDISVYEKEYAETGGLKDESYKELSKLGLSKSVVDKYIEGQKALFTATISDIKSTVGGDTAFDGIISWAAEALSEAEKTAYNKVVESNDNAAIKLALAGLQAKYNAATGYAPSKNVTGAEGAAISGYESNAQLVADMKDPRYKSDEAYRRKVAEKIKRSSNIN